MGKDRNAERPWHFTSFPWTPFRLVQSGCLRSWYCSMLWETTTNYTDRWQKRVITAAYRWLLSHFHECIRQPSSSLTSTYRLKWAMKMAVGCIRESCVRGHLKWKRTQYTGGLHTIYVSLNFVKLRQLMLKLTKMECTSSMYSDKECYWSSRFVCVRRAVCPRERQLKMWWISVKCGLLTGKKNRLKLSIVVQTGPE